jgi:ATP-binding cassette subfamily C (CFTR/MRP) protein 1
MQTSLGLLIVLHIVFLVLVTNSPILRHPASLAAGVLAIVGIGTAMVASFYEHTRSVAPSSILQTYFLAVILLDMTRVRTLWLIDNSPPAVLLSLVLGFEILTFSLKYVRKTKSLTVNASTEERSGLWERALFSWLLSMLRRGYSSTLSLNCLPVIDSKLDSQTLHDNLLNSWRLSKRTDY